jgi:hypothetical protein
MAVVGAGWHAATTEHSSTSSLNALSAQASTCASRTAECYRACSGRGAPKQRMRQPTTRTCSERRKGRRAAKREGRGESLSYTRAERCAHGLRALWQWGRVARTLHASGKTHAAWDCETLLDFSKPRCRCAMADGYTSRSRRRRPRRPSRVCVGGIVSNIRQGNRTILR